MTPPPRRHSRRGDLPDYHRGADACRGSRRARFDDLIRPATSNTIKKATIAEAARIFSVAVDSAITPMAAGEAMLSLRAAAPRNGGTFQFRADVPMVTPPWESAPYDSTLFRVPADSARFDPVEAGPERWHIAPSGTGWLPRRCIAVSRAAGRLLRNPWMGGCAAPVPIMVDARG